jgi:hypothetical protein
VVKYQTKIYQNGEPALMRAWQEIPGSILVGLLEQVRTRVLRFALDLKDSLPDEATTASDVLPAEVDRSVVNIFYGGNNLIATNTAHVSQVVQQTVTQIDLPSLISAMHELGITKEGMDALQTAIAHDKPETNAETARQWASEIGKYIGKEGMKIGVEVAKQTARCRAIEANRLSTSSRGSIDRRVDAVLKQQGRDLRREAAALDQPDYDLVCAIRHGAIDTAEQVRLRIDQERHALVVAEPSTVVESVLAFRFAPEHGRDLDLVALQDIHAKSAILKQRLRDGCACVEADQDRGRFGAERSHRSRRHAKPGSTLCAGNNAYSGR